MGSDPQIGQSVDSFVQNNSAELLDVRTKLEFEQGHYKAAANIPLSQISERVHEFPNRNIPLRVCVNQENCQEAIASIKQKGYQIQNLLVWNDSVKNKLNELNLLESGNQKNRIWQPARVVEYFQSQWGHHINKGIALDLACGTGRDATYLATQGWQVTAIDYLSNSLSKAQELAGHQGVKIQTHCLDLEDKEIAIELPAFNLTTVVRYLHRPLFPWIDRHLAKNGFLVYQTFLEGSEKFGQPKRPRFLLKYGELAKAFSHYRILLDEVEYLEDGRPTNIFIAQK